MPAESPVIFAPLSENVMHIVPSTVVMPLSSVPDSSVPLSLEPESEPELDPELEPEFEFDPGLSIVLISLPLQAIIIRTVDR